MGGQEDLIRVMDATLEKSEIKEVISALQPLKEEIRTFSGISIFTKSTAGAAEFRVQSEQLQAALEKIRLIEIQLEALRAKNHAANRSRTDQEIADSQKKAQATRTRVAEIRSEEDAYRKLTNEYNKHSQAVKIAAATYGVHSKEVRAATAALRPFEEQLHKVNKAADDGRSFVGRYAQGVKESFKDIVGQAAQMVGAFYLIQKAFSFISDSVKEFMAAEASTARLKNILSNMGREDVMGELARDAKELSEELGTVTEKDVTETFQKLVTYGKLTKNQILELTPVIADFAAKQRIDMPEATGVITKALEGNSRGLKEYGINVKEGKDATERFGIIMSQLAPKVKGATQAQGDLSVEMKKAEVATEELKVKIGEEFAPAISTVWQAILEGVHGLPQLLTGVKNFFAGVADASLHAYYFIKAGFGSVGDLANYEDQKKKSEKILADSKLLQDARESAEGFRKVASKESLSDQAKHLVTQNALLKVDSDRYELLKKTHQLNTEEGRKATENVVRSVAIVKALTEQLKSSRDTRVLGNGDPNDDGKAAERAAKAASERAKKKAQDLEDEISYQKTIADEKDETIAARLEAYNAIEELEKKQDLSEHDRMINRIDQIGRLAKIRFDALNADKVLAAENAKELEDIAAKHYKAMEDLEKQARQVQRDSLLENSNIHHSATDRDFLSGKISKEEYLKKNKENDFNDQKDQLTAANNNAQADLKKDPNNTGLQVAASGAQSTLDDFVAKHQMELNEKVSLDKKEKIQLGVEYAKEAESVVASFVRARYENELNAIQKNIDANNKAKEKETASIQNSTLSIQEKAAAQINLDAQVNANNEALQRKQRDVKVKEAKFDRDQAIFGIIANTALGVMKAAPIVPLMIATAVAGAVELAIVASKPIPTYRGGVKSKPEDGLMKVHPGEIRIDPDGTISMTPNAPETLTYGKKGTRIIPAHEANKVLGNNVSRQMMNEMNRVPVHQVDNGKDIREMKEALQEIGYAQLQVMKKKQDNHIHIHFDPKFSSHIDNAVRN